MCWVLSGPQEAPAQLPRVTATAVTSRGLPARDCQYPSPSSPCEAVALKFLRVITGRRQACTILCLPVTSHCSLHPPSRPNSMSWSLTSLCSRSSAPFWHVLLACATTQQAPWDSVPGSLSFVSPKLQPLDQGQEGLTATSGQAAVCLGQSGSCWAGQSQGGPSGGATESSSPPVYGASPSFAAGFAERLSWLLCENQVKWGPAGLWIGTWIFHCQPAAVLLRLRRSNKQKNKDDATSCFSFTAEALTTRVVAAGAPLD